MQFTRRILATAALALGTTLAACSDTSTAPQAGADNSLVAAVNRLANGHGEVLSATAEEGRVEGAPEPVGGPAMDIQPCEIDNPDCAPPPSDCFDACSWFDVDSNVSTGLTGSGQKYANLTGTLYAYSDTYYADVYIDFYSAGGCTTPTKFDGVYMSGYNGPFTLSASREFTYDGTFTWAVNTDGYAQDVYGVNGYESEYYSVCY